MPRKPRTPDSITYLSRNVSVSDPVIRRGGIARVEGHGLVSFTLTVDPDLVLDLVRLACHDVGAYRLGPVTVTIVDPPPAPEETP